MGFVVRKSCLVLGFALCVLPSLLYECIQLGTLTRSGCMYFGASRIENNSTPAVMADSPLCKTCSALDLNNFFREGTDNSNPIALGALTTIFSRKTTCGLCRMISLLISRNWSLHLYPDADLKLVEVHLAVGPCGWAESNYPNPNVTTTCAHSICLIAIPPAAVTRTVKNKSKEHYLDLQMMEDDAARFGRERAFHGRRVGAEVSIDLVRNWLRTCEKEHGPACSIVWRSNEQLPQGARMIDVIDMALVEAPSNCKYMALSYVWGKISSEFVTLLENVSERHKRYSLKTVELPRTICDAIKLVQELKERYLWVDALCIIQDDPVNKDTQIAGMNMIYSMATLTIIAASGNSAHAPLPGLELGSRKVLQHIESIQSLLLAVPLKTLLKTVPESVWHTRGWTFQEQILSRRKLFFTNEQLFFQCQRETFSEDVIVESCKETGTYPSRGQWLIQLHPPERPIRYDHMEFYQSAYAKEFMRVIEEYTRRQLTNPADIYNAVFALITVFSHDFEITPLDPKKAFLFGMPVSLLEDAMLWQPGLDAPAHARRHVEGLVTPSWSWAGWKGNVMYDSNISNGFQHGFPGSWWKGSLVNEWVIGNLDGVPRRISPDFTERGGSTAYLKGFIKYIGLPNPPSAPLVEEGESLAPGMLLFRTTAAFLRVRKYEKQVDEIAMSVGVRTYYSKFHSVFKILSDTSPPTVIGMIVLPSDTDSSDSTVLVEFVVLSRSTTGPHPHHFDKQVLGAYYGDGSLACFLNVMVVKRVGVTMDGMEVSERVGVGYIWEEAWIAGGFCERVVRLQ